MSICDAFLLQRRSGAQTLKIRSRVSKVRETLTRLLLPNNNNNNNINNNINLLKHAHNPLDGMDGPGSWERTGPAQVLSIKFSSLLNYLPH
jgi:hypothetical protein